jgi:hypothetical protein
MDRGLRAPLSPNEEIALRRVAYGSVDVAARHVERLTRLALVESHDVGLRLTSVGVRRVESLGGPIVDAKRISPLAVWLPLARPAPLGPRRTERERIVPSTLPVYSTWTAVLPSK